MSEDSGDNILLVDLVQVEVVVNVFGDDDSGDDEALLSEVRHVNVVISPVIPVVVDVIDDGVSEPEVQILLGVVDEDADDDGTYCECEC